MGMFLPVQGTHTVESIAEGSTGTGEREMVDSETLPASTTGRQRKRNSMYHGHYAHRPPTSPLIHEGFSFAASSEPDSMVEGDETSLSRDSEMDRTTDSEPLERSGTASRMKESKGTQTEDVLLVVGAEEGRGTPRPRWGEENQVRLTLGGLGFQQEEDGTSCSSRTTPLLATPYSPADMSSATSESVVRGLDVDSRTGALLLLIEHVSKLLVRLRQADVPTLTRRLKKQHLVGGDVGHLSKSEIKALNNEMTEMRGYFRTILEDERRTGRRSSSRGMDDSAVTKKDFNLLLKLFKELFSELIELRGIVNDVTVNPALAVELKRKQESLQVQEDEPARGRGKGTKGATGGLGWIAAPITKLFTAPSSDPPINNKSGNDKNLLQPPNIRSSAVKLMPSTSATTTQVSVEFASSGQVRRATHALPTVQDDLPASPVETLTRATGLAKSMAIATQQQQNRGSAISLADGSTRGAPGDRQSLYGIFAGGSSVTHTGMIPEHRSQTVVARNMNNRHRRQLSTVVDAVLDDDHRYFDPTQPALLERTLRPRGLSDSSIRTTFQQHGAIASELQASNQAQQASYYGSYWPAASAVKNMFGKRFQALAGSNAAGTNGPTAGSALGSNETDENSAPSPAQGRRTDPMNPSTMPALSPRTIVKKKSATNLGFISPASMTDTGGFLGMLSASTTNDTLNPMSANMMGSAASSVKNGETQIPAPARSASVVRRPIGMASSSRGLRGEMDL
jgi:hypothetical protein